MKTKTFFVFTTLCSLIISGLFINVIAQPRPVKYRPTSTHYYSRIDTIQRKGVFTSYPTNFIASTLKVGYEFRVSDNKGLKLIGSYGASTSSGSYYSSLDRFNETSLEAQLRFYVLKDRPALNGLYLAPYAFFKSMTYSGNQGGNNVYLNNTGPSYLTNATAGNFSVGYIIGYQYIYNSTLTLDAFIGGGNNFISGDNSGGNLSSSLYAYRNGIDLHTGISIGVAF